MDTAYSTKLINGQIFTNLSSQFAADVEICREINARLEKQKKKKSIGAIEKKSEQRNKVKDRRYLIVRVITAQELRGYSSVLLEDISRE